MPNGKYKGQKLIKEVSKKTMANTNKIMPAVPSTVFVKNNMAKRMATKTLIALSAVPIFFFITKIFKYETKLF